MNTRTTLLLAALAVTLLSFTSHSTREVKKSLLNEGPNGVIYIVIDKSNYELNVYDAEGWFATYPVVFGSKTQDDKMMEGDRKTPEGSFKIIGKRPHDKWGKFMLLDYPNKESWQKFNRRKSDGIIPKTAKIGGGIGIHGTWPRDETAVDYYQNWTQGCISMKLDHLYELYDYCPVGTRVIIKQ
ncbi:MAG TPA: L,D-transpeptidase [Chitinophagaceae bacterium]|nr:L,D-transpeptidase [Chitinophagaceae bacterium]